MHIKRGSKLYVRIDYKVGEKRITHQDLQDHLAYVKSIAAERYFMGGIFSKATNSKDGMCIFEAESFEEAEEISQNDPIIRRGLYHYDLYEWDLIVLSSS